MCTYFNEKQLYLGGGSRPKIEPCFNMLEVTIKCPVLLKNTGRYSMIYLIFLYFCKLCFQFTSNLLCEKMQGVTGHTSIPA